LFFHIYHRTFDTTFPITGASEKVTGVLTLHNKVTPSFIEQDLEIGAILASYSSETLRAVRATETLLASEVRFRDMAEMLPESIFETDIEMNLIYANRHAFLSFGYSEEDLIKGLNCFSLIDPSDVERARKNLVQRLKGRDPGLVEYLALKKNGSVFPIIFKMAPILEDKGVIGFRGIVVDITQRKKTEEEIRSLAKFPSENPNPVLRFYLNGNLIYANSAAYKSFSDWKLKEQKPVHPILQELAQEIEKRHSHTKDVHIGRHIFSITVTFHPEFGYINVYAMDITKRKQTEVEKSKLEEQLRRAQKLETIGTLAGGIAHDFNNILTPILGYTDMALFELSDSDPLKKNLSRVLEAANRAKNLIEQILLFSKQITRVRLFFIFTTVKCLNTAR
jgi:PAS domain S-box-containing protein